MSIPFDENSQTIQEKTEVYRRLCKQILSGSLPMPFIDFIKEMKGLARHIPLIGVEHDMLNAEDLQNTRQQAADYMLDLWSTLQQEPDVHEVFVYPETPLQRSVIREKIVRYSPSISLRDRVRSSQLSLHNLHWRQLEELVAQLLTRDGYQVTLGPGTKDGGVDIIAMKEDPIIGVFLTVWQAKKLKAENKVDIHVIRELADTRQQHNATKGIIVTTTTLTRGALARIEQDRYLLGKVDGDDLSFWIQKGK